MLERGQRVVFVVLDTVRKDHLSVYDYDAPTTPVLDRFADTATVFDQAVAPAPWTLPVHASMFTGQYPSEHGASQENPYLDEVTTLATSLSQAGFATACYSSNAWITPYTGLTAGFDDHDNFFEVMPADLLAGPLARAWQTMNDHKRLRAIATRLVELGNTVHEYLAGGQRAGSKTPEAINRAIEFLNRNDEAFVFLNLMDAHLPYHPPKAYAEEFAPGVDSTLVCQNSKEYNAGARSIDAEEWAAIRGLYDAEIRHMDAEIERLFEWLKRSDLWEDTVVIVCADHGELHGEHGLYGHEFCIYEPLVNVPLLMKHPALDPGRRSDQVELIDLYHTVLDSLAVTPPATATPFAPERSLLSADYRDFEGGEDAFIEYYQPVVELKQLESKANAAGIDLDPNSRFYSRMRAVRRVGAKFIQNERLDDEFYRLDGDPSEAQNRIGSDDPTETALRQSLAAFVDRVGAAWDDNDQSGEAVLDGMADEAQDRLRDLGYLE